jgi:hypothetical protein
MRHDVSWTKGDESVLAIVGKASPNPETGDIEFYLREFDDRLARTGHFVYARTFNPDATAIEEISRAIASGEPVFLSLPSPRGRHVGCADASR